ncbi:MAG: hypothetical protein QGI44_05100 [Candidatus Marinimicrobia bacterium]|nr:hypothetical protein [Candidatus Neomarinimicrobiota bacterium]
MRKKVPGSNQVLLYNRLINARKAIAINDNITVILLNGERDIIFVSLPV